MGKRGLHFRVAPVLLISNGLAKIIWQNSNLFCDDLYYWFVIFGRVIHLRVLENWIGRRHFVSAFNANGLYIKRTDMSRQVQEKKLKVKHKIVKSTNFSHFM